MDHVLSHIPSRELPVQSPIYELVWIERPGTPPVEKEIPVNVAGSAIRGNGTDPLTFAFGRITAHPGFDVRNLAGHRRPSPSSRAAARSEQRDPTCARRSGRLRPLQWTRSWSFRYRGLCLPLLCR